MSKKLEEVSGLKVGRYCIVDDVPCRIVDIQTSKPGRHGHAKCRITAIGLIDNQKRIVVRPAHDKIEVPIVEKNEAQVLSINNNVANVMDLKSYETFDLEIPQELANEVKEGIQIIYWSVLGERVLKQVK